MSRPFKMKGFQSHSKAPIYKKSGSGPIKWHKPEHKDNLLKSIQKGIKTEVDKIKEAGSRDIKKAKDFLTKNISKQEPLSSNEKKIIKNLGISDYQWRTDGIGGSMSTRLKIRNAKRKLSKSFETQKIDVDPVNVINLEQKQPVLPVEEIKTKEKKDIEEVVDYGEGFNWQDWSQESTTGWNLHELVKERNENIVPTYGKDSEEYKKIQDVINKAKKETGKKEKDKKEDKEEVAIETPEELTKTKKKQTDDDDDTETLLSPDWQPDPYLSGDIANMPKYNPSIFPKKKVKKRIKK